MPTRTAALTTLKRLVAELEACRTEVTRAHARAERAERLEARQRMLHAGVGRAKAPGATHSASSCLLPPPPARQLRAVGRNCAAV